MNLKKILLADGSADYREVLCHYLYSLNYPRPFEADDGEEALSIALIEKPDLIITEVLLPKQNGFQIVSHLRADPSTRDTVIIAATAIVFPQYRERCLKSGFNGYLAKPFTRQELNDILRALLCHHAAPNGSQ